MKTITHPAALLFALLLSFPMMSLAQSINRCDELAADPENPDNPTAVTGVKFEEIQTEVAITACEKAVADSPQSPRYQFQLGRAYDANGDYSTAIKWYQKATEQEYSLAQYYVGHMYYIVRGVKQSYQTADKWNLKAAEQGNARTQFILGQQYNYGLNVKKSYQTAAKWYRKAAEQGYADAQNNLGIMYDNGQGVKKNYILAYAWYNEAIANGEEQVAPQNLRNLEQQMTPEQIAVAQMINPLEVDEYGNPKKESAPKTLTESVVGTAFLVNQQYLLSNYHVIKSCQSLRVANAGFQSSVTVIQSDERNDLALLKASNSNTHSLTLSSEYSAKQGDSVIAMGYPYGEMLGNEVKLSTGSISALSGLSNDASMYQMTAPVQPGNSGGPLLNDAGQVIGIVTARLTKELESENVNFAVKSNVARLFLDGNNIRYKTANSDGWFKPNTAKIAKKAKKAIVQVICKQ